MQRVSFACSCLMLGVACAGGEDAGTPSSFVEPGPTDAELQEHLHTLLDEFEPRVSAAARAEFEEHVATASADASADAGVDAPGELASTNTVSAFLDLGELAFLSGSASGATWAFLRAVEEDPDDIAALAQLGFVLTYEERHADARPFLLHAYALGPDRLYTVLVTLGLSYAAEGDYERCIYFLERAVSNEPNDAHLQHELAKCYFRMRTSSSWPRRWSRPARRRRSGSTWTGRTPPRSIRFATWTSGRALRSCRRSVSTSRTTP